MRLSRAQKLAAICHEDHLVRNEILSHFIEQIDGDTSITHNVIASLETHGWRKAFPEKYNSARGPLDSDSFVWFLRQLERVDAEAPDTTQKAHVIGALVDAPSEILAAHFDRYSAVTSLFPDELVGGVLAGARSRLDLEDLDQSQCLDLLEHEFGNAMAIKDFFKAPRSRIDRLAERLSRFDMDAWALDLLKTAAARPNPETQQRNDYLVGCAILVAGHRKLSAAIPHLLELYRSGWEWWAEEINSALTRIGNAEVILQAARCYPTTTDSGRLYLTGVFQNIPIPEAIPAIREILAFDAPGDFDRISQICLGQALANHYDDAVTGEAKQIYLTHEEYGDSSMIAKTLYAHSILTGYPHAELEKWREQEEKFIRVLQSANSPRRPAISPAAPGRNDPCSCGSGKKYKKCCHAKA